MYAYIKGMVTNIDSTFIVVENQGIGYLINVANAAQFQVGQEYTIYVYQYIREDENSLYGFSSKEEKELFLKLVNVKGVGCKMALGMFTGSVDGIIDAIERENILYLKKFPKIGDKVARQMILDLKGKLVSGTSSSGASLENQELVDTLKALGYKPNQISKVLPKIDTTKKLEQQVKDALKWMMK